ncbi:hypothetical protein AMTR_s00050p00210650 [Amborella trichopoda]|uniref:Uncharacterized protein n=1 Tax=Amborella trichopoda TaxID=13333 RepID=W1PY08_AMBTC|nr:hypothetical protein AMTR_s00050p00210650 [Amborella trichopoda]
MTLSVSLGDIVTKYVCDPICGQIPYLLKHKRNVEELTEAIDELTSKPNDIQREVATLTGAGKINTCQINQWLEAVGEIEEEATRIKDEYEQGRTCLRGLGTNYWSSYRLSKRAVKLKIKADRQCEKLFERLAITPPPESAIDLETGTIEDQPTAKHTKEEVLNYIADDRISVIGVYGMGGIGKTTLMENLLNVLRTKRYLIILDDMWKRLDLKEIGIPQPKKQDGCKIVVESRRKDVCHNMQAECIVEVKKLSDEEAWSLFLNNAGHHISSQLTEPHARKVLKKCGGLPLAIITLARAMPSKESKEAWEDALRILNMSAAGLQGNEDLVAIPTNHFFECMPKLRVLDLCLTNIESLPYSVSHLVNLRVLILCRCKKLKKLPPTIGKLNQLQMLDLEGCTAIKELDSGLAELTNLIFLNLSAMSGLKSLPTGLLCSLVNLEYLNVFISGGLKWSTARSILEESWMSAWELTRLVCLSYPSICIKGVMDWDWLKLFPQRLLCLGLTDCTLTNDAFVASEESQSIEFFSFLNCKGMKGAPSPRLGYLEIKGSKDLECVMVGEEAKEHSFQSLEVTYLEMLPKLERICIGVPPHVCFAQKLEELSVVECMGMEEIIEENVEENGLTNLRSVTLVGLPKMVVIRNEVLAWESLELVAIVQGPMLKKLPYGLLIAKRLQAIVVERELLTGLDELEQGTIRSLRQLKIIEDMGFGVEVHPHMVDPNVEIPIVPSSIGDRLVDPNMEMPPGPSSLWEQEQGDPFEDEITKNVLPIEVSSSKGKQIVVCNTGVSPLKMEFGVFRSCPLVIRENSSQPLDEPVDVDAQSDVANSDRQDVWSFAFSDYEDEDVSE